MIYTIKNIVVESDQIVYNDGITNLFLYTKGTIGGSRELKELLAFMENPICNNAVDPELSKILDIVDTIKGNSEERRFYMKLMGATDYMVRDGVEAGMAKERAKLRAEVLAEGLAEGRAEGLAEGLEEGLAEGRAEGLAEGRIQGAIEYCKLKKIDRELTKNDIMQQFSISEEEATEYLNLYW